MMLPFSPLVCSKKASDRYTIHAKLLPNLITIDMVNRSVSSHHRHFKEATAMSPLQFQKQLRLYEARRLLLSESADAAEVAFRIGYESPSQFSREYSRMFGFPPKEDIKRMKANYNQ